MFRFKQYDPLKYKFTYVQSENSIPSSPSSSLNPLNPSSLEACDVHTPEPAKPPSLPSSAVLHASNALLILGDYVSNTFQ
jgi:hypothetical protein